MYQLNPPVGITPAFSVPDPTAMFHKALHRSQMDFYVVSVRLIYAPAVALL